MQKNMDMIQIEYRYEISDLLKIITGYEKAYPGECENETLVKFKNILEQIDMEW